MSRPDTAAGTDATGVLLLYNRPAFFPDAATITDHIEAFGRFSRFPVRTLNTSGGFPEGLRDQRPQVIVLHYTLFASGPYPYMMDQGFLDYVRDADAYKVAFFQDEHEYCRRRFEFLDTYEIDCVYTCFPPSEFEATYGSHTRVPRLVSYQPAYVSSDLIRAAERLRVPDAERPLDVVYRARPTPPYFGRGGVEKVEIAERFAARAAESGLRLDISTREEDRLYGEAWYGFLAGSRGVLGTESGASCVDLEDEVREEYLRMSAGGADVTIEQLERGALGRWDGRVQLRTTSARHFEAAALEICQVMYEGEYAGVLRADEHYIPLRKDFSNFDEALERFLDPDARREITERAYADLIAAGDYGYERFIAGFDRVLEEAGMRVPAVRTALPVPRGRPPAGVLFRYLEGASGWLERKAPRLWRVLWRASRPLANALRRASGGA